MKIKGNKLTLILCLLVGVFVVLELGIIQPVQAQSLTIEKIWGGRDEDYGSGIAIDPSGSIYVTGETNSFGAGQADVLLLKYDPNGTLLWQKTWGGKNEDFGWAVAVNRSGNVYVTGVATSFGAGWDVLLLKYGPDGTLLWQKTWGGKGHDLGCGLDVDPAGSIYVIGRTYSFGAGHADALLLKYGPDGTLLWQKTWGGKNEDYVRGHVAVDPSGSIYVTGKTYSFGAGQRDVLLLKYDPNGALLWQKIWGGTEWDSGCALAVDPSGSIYVTGVTASSSRTLQDVSGTETEPTGTITEPTGFETTPDGTMTETAGTETTPDGSETYAGGQDAFLLVFTLP